MRSRSRFAAPVLVAAACVIGSAALTACSDEPDRSASMFCTTLNEQLPTLEGPTQTQADLDALAARYDALNEITPLAVQDDWQTLTDLVHTAVTVVPADPESVQELADAAYASERSARNVETWVDTTCGIAFPAVIGLEDTLPPTLPPDTSTPP
jgi:hypothetical protein